MAVRQASVPGSSMRVFDSDARITTAMANRQSGQPGKRQ